MYKETLKMNKYDCTIGYLEHGHHKGGPAGFWIFVNPIQSQNLQIW